MCLKLFYSKIKILKGVEIEFMIVPKSGEDFAKKRKGQEFTSLKDKYIYNKKTGELEKLPIQEDLQELVDSYADTALDKIFDKFDGCIPQNADREAVYGYAEMRGDLSDIASMYDKAEYYKEKFGLGAEMSVAEVYEEVGKRAEALKEELKKKGVIGNVEKKAPQPQDEQKVVPQDGEENA